MPGPEDPAGHPQSYQNDCLMLASTFVTVSPPRSGPQSGRALLPGLYQTSGRYGLPSGLHDSLCTLRVVRSALLSTSFLASYTPATLGTGGWLDLTCRGLSPHKKRQALLGAQRPSSAAALDSARLFIEGTIPERPRLVKTAPPSA